MRAARSLSYRVLMTCCALASCAQDPDLKATASGELIRIAAAPKQGEPQESLASRAAQELFRRPRAAVVESLRTALEDESPGIRSWAARALGESLPDAIEPPLEVVAREEVEAALFVLLGDEDEQVRSSALYGLGRGWDPRRPGGVPDEIVSAIRSLVVSADPAARFLAATAAMWFGSEIGSLAALLVSQAVVEADSGVRFMLAIAMSRVGPRDAAVASCLQTLLDDAEWKVRCFAATGLGEVVNPPASVVERLRRSVTDSTEVVDVRKSAATSLARLTTSVGEAARTLPALLDVKGLFADQELCSWLDAVGKVAALVPTSEPGTRARSLLESTSHDANQDLAMTAWSGLARIALASGDASLGRQAATELRKVVPSILLAAEQEMQWAACVGWSVPVMEAMVVLAGWPEIEVKADELHLVFAALKRHRTSWTGEWADGQLDRLR